MLGRRNLILLCLTVCTLHVKCADKYTDENRPYEFGFTIDGEQHRHEKKDKNGIIMGEFGFITADGVYHVTVYATDENGNFKILSMKNIRVKPYPTAKSGPERGRSLEYSSSPQLTSKPSLPEENKKQFKELPKPGPASPAKSCSHCKLPTTTTTTTEAPYIPSDNLPPKSAVSQESETPPKLNQYEEKYSQNDVSAQSYLQEEQRQQQLQQGQQEQQLQPGQQQLQQGQQQQEQQQQQLQPGQQQLQQGQQQAHPQQQLKPAQQQLQQGQQQGQQQQQPLEQEQQLLQQRQQQRQQQVDQQPQDQQTQNLQPQGEQPGQPEGQVPDQQEQQARQLQQINQEQEGILQQGQQEQKINQYNNAQNYPPQEIGSVQNYPQPDQNNIGNNPQQTYAQEQLQNEDYIKQQQQETPQPQQYSNGSPQDYPQTGQNSNNNYPQPTYAQDGLGNSPSYLTGAKQGQTNSGDKAESTYPGSITGQTQPQSVTGENQSQKLQPETNRNPKSYDDQSKQGFNTLNSPTKAFVSQENSSPTKPQLISAQMQIVDKNTDIHHKSPGEKEGLPEGLSKDDMSQLLYTFNYTVGFHGHFEEGYKSGAKVGYYYVTGRNGVRTRVDYVADEKGFRPKITQEVLDLLSDDVPKPDTEKDAKYGLKGYEFKWLYYPVDTK